MFDDLQTACQLGMKCEERLCGKGTFLGKDGAWLDGDIAVFKTKRCVGAGQVAWRCSDGGGQSSKTGDYSED